MNIITSIGYYISHISDLLYMYYSAVAVPDMILLIWTFPLYVALVTAWQLIYYRSNPDKSIKSALLRAFPKEDFKTTSTKTDIFCLFANNLISRPLVTFLFQIIMSVAAADLFYGIISDTFGHSRHQMTSALAIIATQSIVLFISNELFTYLTHYMSHKIPLLWASHRTHHSAESLTPITGSSRNVVLHLPTDFLIPFPVEFILRGVVLGTTLYYTSPTFHPVSLQIIAWIAIYGAFLNWFDHSANRISFGPLNYIFYSPAMHQIHHSAEPQHRIKNLGNILSVFDWAFGTLYIPAKHEQWRLGLSLDEIGKNNPHATIKDYLLEPYRYAWSSIVGYFNGKMSAMGGMISVQATHDHAVHAPPKSNKA